MDNNLRLNNKVAVITGGASGIGKEIAMLFSAHGAKVALVDLDESKLNEVKNAIGKNAEIFCTDITDEDSVKSTVNKIEATFGKLDILINCAGIYAAGKITETNYADWNKILNVNLNGAFLCSKYAIEAMLKNKKGAVVNVASEAGLAAIAGQVAYNVSKAAMVSLSNCMAVDYATFGIRVNCVCPGRILTPLVQHIIDSSDNPEETFNVLSHDRPLMRMGTTGDIAYACLHFSDDSMPYATGSVMSVDGGYTAR
ncbi:MAG: glucose 1-dehydrogenase [Defluviitaleaceae bacterium]|nr:glucose 1-dehydrogenase [Defluviitaleaceae bacterium]